MCIINVILPRLQNENYYQSSVIHRVDTNASTHPMMSNFEVNYPQNDPCAIPMNTSCFEMKFVFFLLCKSQSFA